MPPEETQTPEETQIPETIGQVETSNDLAKIEADFAKLKNEIDSLSVTDKAKRCKEIKNAIKEARNAEGNLSDTTIQNRLTQLEDELTQLETSNQPENTFVGNTGGEQVEDNSNSSRRYRTQAEENEAIEEEVQITPVEGGIISGVGSGIGSIEMINSLLTRSGLEKIDFSKEFNAEKIEDLLNRMADHLEKERNVRIGHHDWFKDNAYDRSIKAYREAADALKDEAGKQAIKKYLELEKKLQGRISNTFLKNIAKIDTREMANIVRWLNSASESEIQALAKCQTEDKIIKFFADRNIRISREYASQLKLASTVDEVKLMIGVSRHGSRLSRIARGIKGMSWFSFACVGLDVFLLMEGLNESEMISKYNKMRGEYRKQRAWVETGIGVGALALEGAAIIVYCAACGSSVGVFGTVAGLAIGTVSYIAYELYGARQDKKDFYAQNRYDFVNQKRTKIKQSIVQLFQSDNLNLDASLKKKIKKDREEIGIKDELKTMEDARESLIFQEETASGEFQLLEMFYSMGDSNENNFKKKLTAEQKEEFENQKKKMEGLIKMRKEYIKQYIDRNKRYSVLCDAIGRNTGMACVEQILADSKVYADIKGIQEQNEKEGYDYVQHYKNFANDFDIKGYKKEYKKMLLKEYKKEFEKFEKLHKDNPGLFNLICDGFMSSSYYINNIDFSPRDEAMKEIIKEFNEWVQVKGSNITKASENCDFLKKYVKYINMGMPFERTHDYGVIDKSNDYAETIILHLHEIEDINRSIMKDRNEEHKYRALDDEDVKNKLSFKDIKSDRDNIDTVASESVFQNVLYGIAREIHGYNGPNDYFELIKFYNEGDANSLFIYYDKKRKVNIDWNGDRILTGSKLSPPTKETILKRLFGGEDILAFTGWVGLPRKTRPGEIDSSAEAADDMLNSEFKNKALTIINREYKYIEKKSEYEKKVVDFIKSISKGADSYVEIPEYLCIEAKKAGLGNIHKYYFSVENGEIIALCRDDQVRNNVLHFDSIKIRYKGMVQLRTEKELTQEEKNFINYVDNAEKKLKNLMNAKLYGVIDNDLDIPIELSRAITEKHCEWENIKHSMLYFSCSNEYIHDKGIYYYNYFNGLYVGMLNEITKKSGRNNLSDSSYFISASRFMWCDPVSIEYKDGKKKAVIDSSLCTGFQVILKGFISMIVPKNPGDKTIKELLESDKQEEENKGKEYTKKIFEIMLEKHLLTFGDEGKVKDIKIGDFECPCHSWNQYTSILHEGNNAHMIGMPFDEKKHNKILSILEEARKEVDKVQFSDISQKYKYSAAVDKNVEDIQIREIFPAEIDTHSELEEILDVIIHTLEEEKNRVFDRGDITFVVDSEQKKDGAITGVITSWGYSERITVNMDSNKQIKNIKIDGLNKTFSKNQGLRIANLLNFIKDHRKTHPKGKRATGRFWYCNYGEYWWSTGGDLEMNITMTNGDVDVLKSSTVDKQFSEIKDSSDFITYINKF